MPIYEYTCNLCKKKFEVFKNITDNTVESCILCGSKNIKKIFSAPIGIIFKGTGFYTTDYKRKNTTNTKINQNSTNTTNTKINQNSTNKVLSKRS